MKGIAITEFDVLFLWDILDKNIYLRPSADDLKGLFISWCFPIKNFPGAYNSEQLYGHQE